MATGKTKKTTKAAKKTTGNKKVVNAKRSTTAKSKAEVQEKEELVPGLSNEVVLLITLVISVLLFLSNFSLSGKVGEVINQITFGLFGILAYLIPFFLFFGIAFYLANRMENRRYVVKLVASIALFAMLAAIIQLVFGPLEEMGLLDYYKTSAQSKSGGGLLGGVLCWLFIPLFGRVGSYVVLIAIAVFCIMILTGKALFALLAEVSGREMEKQKEIHRVRVEERRTQRNEQERTKSKAQSFLFTGVQKRGETEERKPEIKRNFFGGISSTEIFGKHSESVTTEDMAEPMKELKENVNSGQSDVINTKVPVLDKETEELLYTGNFQPSRETMDTVNSIYEEELRKKFERVPAFSEVREAKTTQTITEPFEPSFSEQALLDKRQPESETAKEAFAHTAYGVPTKKVTEEKPESQEKTAAEIKEAKAANKPTAEDMAAVAAEATSSQEEKIPQYQFPPVELLTKPMVKNAGGAEAELKQTAEKLQNILESFGVRVSVNNASRGPAVTRYELQPEQGVKVSKITALADDIKLNLAAADIRIEAPIPGKAAVGIEVPNRENTAVYLRELIESPEFVNHGSNIAFTVGKDIGGQNIVADIGKMPHLLIAGSTGSGKSVCINTIIMSILYKAHPDDVKLIMVDPKVVELSVYNGIPHLLIPVVTDPKKASAALNWAVAEMLDRYDKFAALGVRDLKGYNERVEDAAKEGLADDKFPKLPQIVIIVDELADLMMAAPGEVEDAICRLAQMARAAGLHLILATQRPSVNVITGLIKANVPSRVAFAVSSGVDSRTILDGVGAEKLLGKGDMLFFPSGYPKPVRIQGAFVSDKEVSHVVEFLKNQHTGCGYSEEITQKIANTAASDAAASGSAATTGSDSGKDEYFAEAGRFIIEKEKASIGMLQRVYKIGFNRAARIMDQLSEAGVVGPEEGTKPRKILMTLEEFENYLSGQ